MRRKIFVVSGLSAALAGCGAIGTKLNDNKTFHSVLTSAEDLNLRVIGTHGLAREYSPAEPFPKLSVQSQAQQE